MRNRHKIAVFLSIIIILLNSMVAYGQGLIFTDISGHWAEEFINDIYNRKITRGYDDATYRPSNSINPLEAVVMIANLLGYDAEKNVVSAERSQQFSAHRIPAWAHGHLAYLMDKTIVEENELPHLVADGTNTKIKRSVFANYVGKALVVQGGETLSRSFSLPYQDEMFIPSSTKPYVDLLLRKGILDKNSNGGRFLPNAEISRAEVAKLLSLAAAILDEAKPPVDKPQTPVEVPNTEKPTDDKEGIEEKPVITKTLEGSIHNILVGNRTVITIMSDKQLFIYDMGKDVEILIDNKKSNVRALSIGQNVQLTIASDIVTKIEATSIKEVFSGFFERVIKGSTNTVISATDRSGQNASKVVPENVKVYLNGEEATFDSFKRGDVIKLYAIDDVIIEVQGRSKTEFIRGTLTYLGTPSNPVFEVALRDGTKISLQMERNTSIRKDGRVVDFSRLRVSDEVNIELEYDKVKNFNASTQHRKAEGFIRKIVISAEESYIVLESKENVLEEFLIADYTTIRMGKEAAEIYDLRLNYFAEVFIESNEVVRVVTTERVEKERLIGVVTHVDRVRRTVEIEYMVNNSKVVKVVHTKDNTIFTGLTGPILIGNLRIGDELLVIGYTERNIFYAERIIIVQ